MRNLILLTVCFVPCSMASIYIMNIYKAIDLLKDLKYLNEQICFILRGSTPDAINLFHGLQERRIFPLLCACICEHLEHGDTFAEAWKKGIVLVCRNLLSESEKRELLSFSDSFGLGSEEDQIRICSQFVVFCENAITERKNNITKNGKLYLSGGLLLGAFIFIIFS